MHFSRKTELSASADLLYRWHMRPGAFERLTPPWEDVRILHQSGAPSEPGAQVVLSVPLGPLRPLRRRWIAEHRDVEPGRMFRDVQVEGPFSLWEHTHFFRENGSGSILEDRIRFELPLGGFGNLLAGPSVSRSLERTFRYRHDTTAGDLETHRRYPGLPRMKILMTGSSGLVGRALRAFFTTGGHEVVRLVRERPADRVTPDEALRLWNPLGDSIDPDVFEGVDAVVHLGGESIGSGRFTKGRKTRIRESRVRGTRLLSEAIARLRVQPRVMLSASETGIYGDRGPVALDESSAVGGGFLAEVFREWERATAAAERAGVRVVYLRTGMVLSPKAGALARILLPFRLGLGGALGSGRQVMSWVTTDELAGMALHALATEALSGPVNAVAPTPVTNGEFTRILARVLNRPALLSAPGFALRMVRAEMADELLLAGTNVVPKKLSESGYRFRFPDFEGALRHVLGRYARD